jgi:hypothetical protein
VTAPSLEPGYQCHPCHFLAENQLFGVARTSLGLVAVGVQEPPSQAIGFASPDGTSWTPLGGFNTAVGTAAVAVAADERVTVVVGHDDNGATAWASAGGPWVEAASQPDLLVRYGGGAMTSVVAVDGGFVAGGYRDDPLHGKASAAVWRSPDGLTWHLDPSPSFDGGRISGIAAAAGTVVAVGTDGDSTYGPAAAWRWTASTGWLRAAIPAGAGEPSSSGAMRAVVATPAGFVAVGFNGSDNGARAWISTDGRSWSVAPDQSAFRYFDLPLRMQSLTIGPAGLIAGGWRSDAGKGSAVTWTSPDGLAWAGPVWEPGFSGGQIDGVAALGSSVVAVGRTGYPDWNTATIWRAAAP